MWTGGHKWQIAKHEDGRMHQEKKEAKLKDIREKDKAKTKEEEDVKRQLAEIERAALAAMSEPTPEPSSSSTAPTIDPAAAREAALQRSAEMRAIKQTMEQAKRRRLEGSDSTPAPAPSSGTPAVPVPGQPVPAAEGSPWLVCTDPNSGHVYYYNKVTGVSAWERPADLGVDLSKPPPPPKQKPPPPPPKAKQPSAAKVGGWVEVLPEESMWQNPAEQRLASTVEQPDDVEENVHPLGQLKNELMGRKGAWTEEDREAREKEMFQKRSSTSGGDATFSNSRKKASGIRKRASDD